MAPGFEDIFNTPQLPHRKDVSLKVRHECHKGPRLKHLELHRRRSRCFCFTRHASKCPLSAAVAATSSYACFCGRSSPHAYRIREKDASRPSGSLKLLDQSRRQHLDFDRRGVRVLLTSGVPFKSRRPFGRGACRQGQLKRNAHFMILLRRCPRIPCSGFRFDVMTPKTST